MNDELIELLKREIKKLQNKKKKDKSLLDYLQGVLEIAKTGNINEHPHIFAYIDYIEMTNTGEVSTQINLKIK